MYTDLQILVNHKLFTKFGPSVEAGQISKGVGCDVFDLIHMEFVGLQVQISSMQGLINVLRGQKQLTQSSPLLVGILI